MKLLIVGGTGLISTSITRQLLERGDDVTLYNRGQTESRVPPGARRLEGDRKDYATFEAQMRDAGQFDCVIDMICYTPAEAESDLRAFRGRTNHFIFCSTVDVYNKPAESYPIRDDAPRGGVSAYGKDKAVCEQIFEAAHARGDLPVAILRPAQTYGESRAPIHSLGGGNTAFLDRIRKGKPVIVHGDGTSFWVACHADDVARAFVGAARNERAYGEAYNVTGDEWLTWDAYVQKVAEAMGAPAPLLVHVPTDVLARAFPERGKVTQENFQFPNLFDNTAAQADLGFRYTIPFVEGVRRAVAWLDQRGLIDGASAGDPEYDHFIAAWQRACDAFVAEVALRRHAHAASS